ncbi:hypothetical protein LY90DRAFT_113584 [Neocallimastix californiae]|uniref:Uncharacterized protein n=1 Tax=Neocallimastix californiae TaxID=1754190 RepID=A0A1Y2AQH7_9FUNG|nr:hypothetical protein LY90DRAFT_113584 [Neocallimastix californiae]|eukprot:ORY24734.1 hypothetical protein LY90DRAFT_113584 [Neocallimastix californiae]
MMPKKLLNPVKRIVMKLMNAYLDVQMILIKLENLVIKHILLKLRNLLYLMILLLIKLSMTIEIIIIIIIIIKKKKELIS